MKLILSFENFFISKFVRSELMNLNKDEEVLDLKHMFNNPTL